MPKMELMGPVHTSARVHAAADKPLLSKRLKMP